jgi:hypothetical protein
MSLPRPLVVFVDVDDTLIRSFGSKRIPMTPVVDRIRALHADGAVLYAWSSGGAAYAESSTEELGIAACFAGFLPKPDVFIDDVNVAAWRNVVHLHPNEAVNVTVAELAAAVDPAR